MQKYESKRLILDEQIEGNVKLYFVGPISTEDLDLVAWFKKLAQS